jgi:hypothetical protein
MAEVQYDIPAMLKNYGKTTLQEMQELLKRIKVVKLTNKGVGTVQGYYEAAPALRDKIFAKPRNISPSFEFEAGNLVENVTVHRELIFYVKSSSRFFLKPDIGEVFDQMTDEDKKITAAIHIDTGDYATVAGTEGEEFIVRATLLKSIVKKKTTRKKVVKKSTAKKAIKRKK